MILVLYIENIVRKTFSVNFKLSYKNIKKLYFLENLISLLLYLYMILIQV